jgi:hypothetical protein
MMTILGLADLLLDWAGMAAHAIRVASRVERIGLNRVMGCLQSGGGLKANRVEFVRFGNDLLVMAPP